MRVKDLIERLQVLCMEKEINVIVEDGTSTEYVHFLSDVTEARHWVNLHIDVEKRYKEDTI